MKYVFTVLGLVGLDQITKYAARTQLEGSLEVFSFFKLHLTFNPGIAFSLPVPAWASSALAIIFLLFLGHLWPQTQPHSLGRTGLLLLSAGAIGNLIDRLLFGSVTDFLSFWSFPIFNLADVFVSIGLALYIIDDIEQILTIQKNNSTKITE